MATERMGIGDLSPNLGTLYRSTTVDRQGSTPYIIATTPEQQPVEIDFGTSVAYVDPEIHSSLSVGSGYWYVSRKGSNTQTTS